MIAKFATFVCLLGLARASGWGGLGYASGLGYGSGLSYGSGFGYGSGLGYGLGYSGYAAPVVAKTVVAAPIVTKAVIPAVSYAPAVSTVSRYQVNSSPIVKSYAAPLAYSSYVSPYSVSYGHGYSGHGSTYNGLGLGYAGYGSGAYGYGSKYLW